MVLKDFKDIYEQEYKKLNEQQKKAVDAIEGPVMVIAGPGTGKTQILSRRVANILTKDKAHPEEIVCLTYTKAGASEMLDRLEGLIGEEGRNVRVSTIHAFCSELILANPELFGKEPTVMTAAAKYEILKEIMDEHVTEGNLLYKNSGNRYSSIEQILELSAKMKRENLDKDNFEKEIDEYFKMIVSSEEGDEFYKNLNIHKLAMVKIKVILNQNMIKNNKKCKSYLLELKLLKNIAMILATIIISILMI